VDLAILRGEKKAPGRSRLLSWISGEYPDDAKPSDATSAALAPPDPAVQREILRLELEAEVANLQAEADALRSEALAEGRDLPAVVTSAVAENAATEADAPDADATDADEADAAAEAAHPHGSTPPA
jgi:hypothetical protein